MIGIPSNHEYHTKIRGFVRRSHCLVRVKREMSGEKKCLAMKHVTYTRLFSGEGRIQSDGAGQKFFSPGAEPRLLLNSGTTS